MNTEIAKFMYAYEFAHKLAPIFPLRSIYNIIISSTIKKVEKDKIWQGK